ncbi:complement C1q tumor necrosis factor-related protein 3-like [Haliotis rubra]|uniref:complement C1q tumor necrosis factor-related protein 3-like n=1 Tax=Haliotis rubra TaxID=36100 RepID=UPI001EE5E709|nr:complement C1q tumor necrosis factor-related protein 3-like [Haliotis rubra]
MVKTQVEDMTHAVHGNKLSLLKVLQEVKTRNVAFNVNYPSSPSSENTPLIFSTILYNEGSGYSTSTGTFTAPVSGTYVFWTHLALTHANTNMSFDIIKSGGVIMANGYTETDSSIDETDASAITVTHLDKGEETWVQMAFSRDIYPSSSYFGGALLSED